MLSDHWENELLTKFLAPTALSSLSFRRFDKWDDQVHEWTDKTK